MTDIATDATHPAHMLIASDRVEGTAVYSCDGERLGTLSRFMVDKRSGKVAYAILSFGGVLGLGREHYPLPWDVLDYDRHSGGYIVDLDPKRLEHAPRHASGQDHAFDEQFGREIHDFYGLPWPH